MSDPDADVGWDSKDDASQSESDDVDAVFDKAHMETIYELTKSKEEHVHLHNTDELRKAIAAHNGTDVDKKNSVNVYVAIVGGRREVHGTTDSFTTFVPNLKSRGSRGAYYYLKIGCTTTGRYLPERLSELPWECGVNQRDGRPDPALVQVLALWTNGIQDYETDTHTRMRAYGVRNDTPKSKKFGKTKRSTEYYRFSIDNVKYAIAALYSICRRYDLVNNLYIANHPTRFTNPNTAVFVPSLDNTYNPLWQKRNPGELPPFVHYRYLRRTDSGILWKENYLVDGLWLHDWTDSESYPITAWEYGYASGAHVIKVQVNYEKDWWVYTVSRRITTGTPSSKALKVRDWYLTESNIVFKRYLRPRTSYASLARRARERAAAEEEEEEEEEEEAAAAPPAARKGSRKRSGGASATSKKKRHLEKKRPQAAAAAASSSSSKGRGRRQEVALEKQRRERRQQEEEAGSSSSSSARKRSAGAAARAAESSSAPSAFWKKDLWSLDSSSEEEEQGGAAAARPKEKRLDQQREQRRDQQPKQRRTGSFGRSDDEDSDDDYFDNSVQKTLDCGKSKQEQIDLSPFGLTSQQLRKRDIETARLKEKQAKSMRTISSLHRLRIS